MSDQIAYVGDTSGDEILDVTFYEDEVNGETKDFIHIKVPGDKTVEVISEVTDQYKNRFARRWEAYKSMQTIDSGTPLSEWDDVPKGLRDELRHQGFRYVEQVAGAGDNAFARIMGGWQWRAKAQAFLNRGKKSSDEVINQQAEQIKQLQEQMAAILAAVGEKKTRKPKTEATEEA